MAFGTMSEPPSTDPASSAPPATEPAGPVVPLPWWFRVGLFLAGGLYVVAGALKVGDPKGFARMITDYHLAPEGIVPAMAVLLPWWEIAAGALAVAGVWRRGALAVLTGLSGVFFAAGAVTLARGLAPTCACFGALSGRVGPMSVLLELGLLILCGALLCESLK